MSFGFTACEVEQTQEGEMPEVDVNVEGGQLPKFDVDGPDVDVDGEVEMKPLKVPVPKVDVDVKGPGEGEANADASKEE